MGTFATERLRNVVLLGHSSVGKSSLGEALLFASGAISRMGRTEDGNLTADYEPEAVKRVSSTQLTILPCVWENYKVTILDTPGYFDFVGDAISALRVADAAILVVGGSAGVEVGTEQMWRRLRALGVPTRVFVNKLDRENTNLTQVVDSLRQTLGKECVAFQLAEGSGVDFKGLVNLPPPPDSVNAELQESFDDARDRLAEAAAETDDDLANKYLGGEGISNEEMTSALKQGVLSGKVVPVLAGSATKGLGVKELLGSILELLPSPVEVSQVHGSDASTIFADFASPLAALVFKTAADQHVGKVSFIRVYGGTLESNTEVQNRNKNQSERIGQLFVPMGKNQENVTNLVAGEIGAVGRLSVTATGETLGGKEGSKMTLPGVPLPKPSFSMAVFPKSNADADKLSSTLNRLAGEDPNLIVSRDPDTGETLLTGLGDTHVDITVQRAQRKFGVNLITQTPQVPYKETISKTTQMEHRHKQQSGGHGHFAHIMLRLEPLSQGQGVEFTTEVVGGSVPKDFFPAVEKGVRRACAEGVLTGFPVVDTRAVLYDGSFHPVDSASMDFDICGYAGFKKAFAEAGPGLLEPIMRLEITTPDSYTGEIIGDLNSKRGRILGMQPIGDGNSIVEAHAPLTEVHRYALDLRSITQGRAIYTIEFDHEEELPSQLAQQVIQKAKEKTGSKA
jgi:elongation factor G